VTGVADEELLISLLAAAEAVEGSAPELNRLDGYAGDGDLGITMTQAAEALKGALAGSDEVANAPLLSSCGAAIARSAPSTSGTLVATGFLRASKAVADQPKGGVEAVLCAFVAATEGIKARGKASVGDRTLVDGLDAVCNSLELSFFGEVGVKEALKLAAGAARSAAEATAEMEPKAGRASWVPERAKGHPDAGCCMLAIALEAVAARLSAR
jgi:phosphoenolpyruvate---glycerone phosphotransferase subunit DhaL